LTELPLSGVEPSSGADCGTPKPGLGLGTGTARATTAVAMRTVMKRSGFMVVEVVCMSSGSWVSTCLLLKVKEDGVGGRNEGIA
jgi:hypothetical protein